MNWRTKSLIQRTCARLPGGHRIYFTIQRTGGRLRKYDFEGRFRQHAGFARELLSRGTKIEGLRIFEVGTGWVPLMPIGYWLCGAHEIVTVDLHRYLSNQLLKEALDWLAENPGRAGEIWKDIVPKSQIEERLRIVMIHRASPREFLEAANIRYLAPADATRTGLDAASFDLHTSTSVWEHIDPSVFPGLLAEASRLLRPGGVAFHVVDPTDHFAHADRSIPLINFLRFEGKEWTKYNGNQWAYCNRLFDSDYQKFWADSTLQLLHCSSILDEQSLATLRSEFPRASEFSHRDLEDLSRRELHYFGQKDRAAEASGFGPVGRFPSQDVVA